ncbi:MAG: hypothetical protein IPO75_19325 [Betaproteobacteria bacterium]|nr:hypothetical protein [Betaproteobacteria bacterium]
MTVPSGDRHRCLGVPRWFPLPPIMRPPHSFARIVLACLLGLCASAARAQPATDAVREAERLSHTEPATVTREGRARFFDPVDGQLDLSQYLETARGFLPIPVLVTEPAVGYGGGGIGMFVRPRREAGEAGWARPDLSGVGGIATENGTWGVFAGDVTQWQDGRVKTLAGLGTGRVNLDFYGLGENRPSFDQPVRYSLDFTGAVAQGNWRIAPKSPWSVGLRYVYAEVEPKLRDDPVFPDLADRIRIRISAPGAILEYDTRDNVFTPTRGVYASRSTWRRGVAGLDRRFRALPAGADRLDSAAARGDARRAHRLPVVVDGHAVFPAPVRHAARCPRDALPGRPDGVGGGRGTLAVPRPLERGRVRWLRHDADEPRRAFAHAGRHERRRGLSL